jgi:hypothetical protein
LLFTRLIGLPKNADRRQPAKIPGFRFSTILASLESSLMAIERTLSIIKPDAVAKNVIGQIYARFEGAGLKVIAAKMVPVRA